MSRPFTRLCTIGLMAAVLLVSLPAQGNMASRAAGALTRVPPRAGGSDAGFYPHVSGDFPSLPPDPYEDERTALPPLDEELAHRRSYLYDVEGRPATSFGEAHRGDEALQAHGHDDHESDEHRLRLPEDWVGPQPVTAFAPFLGTGPIRSAGSWFGTHGYAWEPRFVAAGAYEIFGFALEENRRRQDAIGHQLWIDLDLRLTGTERLHVQFRPLGKDNTGGSFYAFSEPDGYVDNSSGEPERYWFEGELHSIFGSCLDPFVPLDVHVVGGRFPFLLHNGLMMNDEVRGVVLNKNTIYFRDLSNLNVQLLYAADDVSHSPDGDASAYGVHVSADRRLRFYELSYVFLQHERGASRDAHYAGISRTQLIGPMTVAARALAKWGDEGDAGSGQLFSLESNWMRKPRHPKLGIEEYQWYANAFLINDGWNSIAGGNLNRLRSSFETNPLVRIAAGRPAGDAWGLSGGVQLFRHHRDISWIPEGAIERREGRYVYGVGVRHLRKTGPRSFLELLGVANFSRDPRFRREGLFLSYRILF